MKVKWLNPTNPFSIWSFWKDLKRDVMKYEWKALKSKFLEQDSFFTMTRNDQGNYPQIKWASTNGEVSPEIIPSFEKIKKCLYGLYVAQTTSFRMIATLAKEIPSTLLKVDNQELCLELHNKQFPGACVYPFFSLYINVCEQTTTQQDNATWPFPNMCYATDKQCASCQQWHRAAKEWLVTYSWMYWSGENFAKPWDLNSQKFIRLEKKILSKAELDFLTNIPESKQIVTVSNAKTQAKKTNRNKQPIETDIEDEEEDDESSSGEEEDEATIIIDGVDPEEDDDEFQIPAKAIIPLEDGISDLALQPPKLLLEDEEEAEIFSNPSDESDNDEPGDYDED